jgi:hypothetical protein
VTSSEVKDDNATDGVEAVLLATLACIAFCVVEPLFVFSFDYLQQLILSPPSPVADSAAPQMNSLDELSMILGLWMDLSMLIVIVSGIVSYVFCCTVGLPVHFILWLLKLKSLLGCIISGAISSLAIAGRVLQAGHNGLGTGPLIMPDIIGCGPVAASGIRCTLVRLRRLPAMQAQ